MAIRPIITAPDARLRVVSKPVKRVDGAMRALMDDMLETMYAAPGIGLAAVQVGVPLRIIVMDLSSKEENEAPAPLFFVNPEILDPSEEMNLHEEGCLSVPDYYDEVERPARCRVKFLDYDGKAQTFDAVGMLATCIQHELDHLEGVLFIDHLSRLKRDRVLRKLRKEQRLAAAE
jgi:peptide deformylase